MKTLYLATAALGLSLAACGDYSKNEAAYDNESGAYADGEGNFAEGAGGTEYAETTGWPEGARIVVVDGVAYRVMPSGERIQLGPNDSRILVEEGVTYRVDPGGTRVRIDEEGAVIDIDADGVSAAVNTN